MALALRGARGTIRWGLAGARAVEPRPEGLLEGRLHFFVGERPAGARTCHLFEADLRGRVPGDRPGAGVAARGVEYSLEVAPGADLSRVRFRYQGARVTARADGSGLEIQGAGASLREEKLLCYQPEGERRRPVGARYARVRRTADGAEYGLQLDRHDASRPW